MIGFYMVWGVNGGKKISRGEEKKVLIYCPVCCVCPFKSVAVFDLANCPWPITQPISKSCTILPGTTCTVHAFSMEYPV